MGIKKKVFFAWVALELSGLLIAVPTTAKIFQQNAPKTYPRIAAITLPAPAGESRILLSANGPFAIVSSGGIGKMNLSFQIKGSINGQAFGSSAQAPGPLVTCVHTVSGNNSLLYTSTTKTADRIGPVLDQAIMVEINYDPSLNPKFDIVNLYDDRFKEATPLLPCNQPA